MDCFEPIDYRELEKLGKNDYFMTPHVHRVIAKRGQKLRYSSFCEKTSFLIANFLNFFVILKVYNKNLVAFSLHRRMQALAVKHVSCSSGMFLDTNGCTNASPGSINFNAS